MKAEDYRPLRVKERWAEAGADALAAASECVDEQHWRSAISRSYYAAYSFSASALARQGVAFKDDRVGPDHEALPDLIRDQLKKQYGFPTLRDWRQSVRLLYYLRIRADYHPYALLDKTDAKQAVALAIPYIDS